MKLPLRKAVGLVEQAKEEETRESIFRMYLAVLPNMDKKNFKTFNEFYEDVKPKRITLDSRSQDEIMDEVMAIQNQINENGVQWKPKFDSMI